MKKIVWNIYSSEINYLLSPKPFFTCTSEQPGLVMRLSAIEYQKNILILDDS